MEPVLLNTLTLTLLLLSHVWRLSGVRQLRAAGSCCL